jgi:hypothetical protein
LYEASVFPAVFILCLNTNQQSTRETEVGRGGVYMVGGMPLTFREGKKERLIKRKEWGVNSERREVPKCCRRGGKKKRNSSSSKWRGKNKQAAGCCSLKVLLNWGGGRTQECNTAYGDGRSEG